MQRVVLDANVLVSYLTGRHEKQYDAASVLLQEAEDGNLVAILPQFVVFESELELRQKNGKRVPPPDSFVETVAV